MSLHDRSAFGWVPFQDRLLSGVVAAVWRRRRELARGGWQIGAAPLGGREWLSITAPQHADHAVVLQLRDGHRGSVHAVRVRTRRTPTILRLDDLWLVNAPDRLVEMFHESVRIVSETGAWGARGARLRALWATVTLNAVS